MNFRLAWKHGLLVIGLLLCIASIQPVPVYAEAQLDCRTILSAPTIVPAKASGMSLFISAHRFDFSVFPQIDANDISNKFRAMGFGYNHLDVMTGYLDDQEVFIKVIKDNMDISEAAWLTYLNQYGLAVKFIGITNIHGHRALVMEKLNGYNSKMAMEAPKEAVYRKIIDQINQLQLMEINPKDLQFMIDDSTGAVTLIDVALYEYDNEPYATAEELAQKHFWNIWKWESDDPFNYDHLR